jgi:GT2 family glycosyltransferase
MMLIETDSSAATVLSTPVPSVACIVLNWNNWRDTIACVESLQNIDYRRMSVTVVDNGSSDDSVQRIRARFPSLVLIETGKNLGFAAGNNAGIRAALAQKPDYIWLVNNDAQPRAQALTAMVNSAENDAQLGAVGSVLLYGSNPELVQAWGGGRINIWTGRSSHARASVADSWLDYLTAASILLRRTALERIGLLDEGFFLYWEDADLSYRLRRAGWKLAVAPGSIVLHKEHASTNRNFRLLHRYSVASGIRFMLKHSPQPQVSIALFLLLKIGKKIATGRFTHLSEIAGGVRDYLVRRREFHIGGPEEALAGKHKVRGL